MPEFDRIIRGGLLVDGSGGEPFEGDVRITDIHTRHDGQVTRESSLDPSPAHGVTTAVMGNCGVGFAPTPADRSQARSAGTRRVYVSACRPRIGEIQCLTLT